MCISLIGISFTMKNFCIYRSLCVCVFVLVVTNNIEGNLLNFVWSRVVRMCVSLRTCNSSRFVSVLLLNEKSLPFDNG